MNPTDLRETVALLRDRIRMAQMRTHPRPSELRPLLADIDSFLLDCETDLSAILLVAREDALREAAGGFP